MSTIYTIIVHVKLKFTHLWPFSESFVKANGVLVMSNFTQTVRTNSRLGLTDPKRSFLKIGVRINFYTYIEFLRRDHLSKKTSNV